jgi:hypothetical protein
MKNNEPTSQISLYVAQFVAFGCGLFAVATHSISSFAVSAIVASIIGIAIKRRENGSSSSFLPHKISATRALLALCYVGCMVVANRIGNGDFGSILAWPRTTVSVARWIQAENVDGYRAKVEVASVKTLGKTTSFRFEVLIPKRARRGGIASFIALGNVNCQSGTPLFVEEETTFDEVGRQQSHQEKEFVIDVKPQGGYEPLISTACRIKAVS